MAFGIFIHRMDSIYDDSPAERYQFPAQYLSRVMACVGDWVNCGDSVFNLHPKARPSSEMVSVPVFRA